MTGTIHIVVAMKPLDGNYAENALRHGVGGLNISACRIESSGNEPDSGAQYYKNRGLSMPENRQNYFRGKDGITKCQPMQGGRWPSNVILEDSEEVMAEFPVSKPTKSHVVTSRMDRCDGYGSITRRDGFITYSENETSSSRFFKRVKG